MPNYVLSLEPTPTTLEPDTLYLTLLENKVHFAALSASHEVIEGEITSDQLGILPDELARLNTIEALTPYSARILSMAGLLDEPLVEVPTVIDGIFHGEHIEIGVSVNQFEDPTDPDFVFVAPTLYVKNQSPKQPRHILMLVDVSSSMSGAGITAIHNTLPLVFAGLQNDDRISLVSFSDTITTLIDNKSKCELLTDFDAQVALLKPNGGTALNKAILSIAEMPGIVPNHTTVLLLTDGQDISSAKQPPRELIEEFNRRFHNTPPRLFPIGLGTSYDHEFMKQCSIAANFGMIDAREQSRLPEHVVHITNGLAMGLHVGLTMGGEEPASLGILGYNTVNTHAPQRVRKSALESHGIGICIEDNIYPIPASMFLPAPPESVALGWQALLKEQAKHCYDNFALSNAAKMDEIEGLMTTYSSYMEEETRADLTTLLHVLDKKAMTDVAKAIALQPGQGLMMTYQAGWQYALREANRTGAISARYKANEGYIEEMIANLGQGYDATATISRIPAASIQAIDTTTANRFTPTSTLTSSRFTASMSRPPFYPNYHAPSNIITLDRRVDFSKLPADATIESSFAGRETIRLLTGSMPFQAVLDEAKVVIGPIAPLEVNLSTLVGFVRHKMNNTDLSRIGLVPMSVDLSSRAQVVDMSECLAERTGVCRHQSLLTATLVGKLVASGLLPAGNVTHYRAATNQLRSHSFAIYTETNRGSVPVYYLLDPAMGLTEKIATQEDFERCVQRYNDVGLDWILRNFAKDNGFTYPKDEDLKPIGQGAIRLLELKVLLSLSTSDQMHLLNQLIRDGLIPSHQYRIQETPENKTRLWATLLKYGCIFPEETTSTEQTALTASLSAKVDAMEASYLHRARAAVSEPTSTSHVTLEGAAAKQSELDKPSVAIAPPPTALPFEKTLAPKMTGSVMASSRQQPPPPSLIRASGSRALLHRPAPSIATAAVSEVASPEQKLKDGLVAYITKIEKTYGGRFDHAFAYFNFSFFRTWQAENREANYLLTLNLLKRLNNGEPIEAVFPSRKALLSLRKELMSGKAFHDHGINSDDLNKVLDAATQLIETRKKPLVTKDSDLGHSIAVRR